MPAWSCCTAACCCCWAAAAFWRRLWLRAATAPAAAPAPASPPTISPTTAPRAAPRTPEPGLAPCGGGGAAACLGGLVGSYLLLPTAHVWHSPSSFFCCWADCPLEG